VDIPFFREKEEEAEEPPARIDSCSQNDDNLESKGEIGQNVPQKEEAQVEGPVDEEGWTEGLKEGGREGGVGEFAFGDAAPH